MVSAGAEAWGGGAFPLEEFPLDFDGEHPVADVEPLTSGGADMRLAGGRGRGAAPRARARLASGKKTPRLVWALSGVEPRAELRGPARRAGACPRRRDLRRSALGPFAALPASSPQPPP